MPTKLPRTFYEREDVVQISRDLIGKVLYTHVGDTLTSGIIVETEAYNGRTDQACHAYPDVRTPRTETIYGPPGFAYVYLCYGIHHLFNIVTNKKGMADAILVRAVRPVKGIEKMLERRGRERLKPVVTNGPGKLSQAMGISTKLDKTDLCGDLIWVENGEHKIEDHQIKTSTRIGVDYAGEDAKLPWRFTLNCSDWVSK
ncbi:DNA-3-methyladenine glycosylase [Gracilimonas sp.]|uniref:DNA-3-methyladenine glycosylase n=1 Tax=Gracilimonas sp. TaxID=1974203 RepID=UPI0028724024|nr:DNA-3-methyladenine glycosylase [Gracilimonas sp.]